MVTVEGNTHGDLSSNSEWVWNFHSNKTHRKGMNPTIFCLTMDKEIGQTGIFNFGIVTSLGEGKLWIQTNSTPLYNSWRSSSRALGSVKYSLIPATTRFTLT